MKRFVAVRRIVAFAALGSICLSPALAQDASSFWFVGIPENNCSYHPVLRLNFGNARTGTYGIDTSLGESSWGCIAAPPPPADIQWITIPGRTQEDFGMCHTGDDVRGWSTPAQVDTFRLFYYAMCPNQPAFVFRWPDSAYIALRCDSMFLADSLTGSRLNMCSVDSLRMATDHGKFYILKYGARLVDALPTGANDRRPLPTTLTLYQNYPNPFNPATTIAFELPERSRVKLTVYDLLGRMVAVLVDGIEEAGRREVQWNAAGIAGGTYCYRLETRSASSPDGMLTQVKTLVLIK